MVLSIVLPWPEELFWPNRAHGLHWSKKSKPAQQAHKDGYNATLEALDSKEWIVGESRMRIQMNFRRPDNHRYDLDGAYSAMKWYLDGIAEALKVDDSRFDIVTLRRVVDDGIQKPCVSAFVGVVE